MNPQTPQYTVVFLQEDPLKAALNLRQLAGVKSVLLTHPILTFFEISLATVDFFSTLAISLIPFGFSFKTLVNNKITNTLGGNVYRPLIQQ